MVLEHTSYRAYLRSVLAERITKNPSYSLRAMARDLGLKPSQLSEVCKGTKNLSLQSAHVAALKLGLEACEAEYFCVLVQYETAKSSELRESFLKRMRALNPVREIRDLSVDQFRLIADWYHLPIVEMTLLEGFELSAKSVARKLGITALEAQAAIDRLERLELIERDASGRYAKVHENYLFKSEAPNEAIRQFHRQMLAKAAESLETQKHGERYLGSQVFSVDPGLLPEAHEMIEDFRKKMVGLFDRSKKRTSTYHLGVQLFNLHSKEKER